MSKEEFDLVVIGGGPAGYVGAIRAAQLGWKVACVEKDASLGGTCLNVGCIPSKALLESSERFKEARDGMAEHGVQLGDVGLDLETMMRRKEKIVSGLTQGVAFLFKKNKVVSVKGVGRIESAGRVTVQGDEPAELRCKKIMIATGSRSASLPGVAPDGDRIGTSTEALAYTEVPKRLVVIGAGAIGLELGSVWKRLGSEVTVLEYLDHILPGADGEIAKLALRLFKKQGLKFHLGARVTGVKSQKKKCVVEAEGLDALEADRVLLAVGRAPQTEGLGLETAGIATDKRGFIKVDEVFQTSVSDIHAVGDVIGGAMLAHKASDEAIACVEQMITGVGDVSYGTIPAIVYTDPEIASVGLTEEALKERGTPYKKGAFVFRANGRAMALGKPDGQVKILAHEETDRVLGVHIIGPRAGDLIAEAAAAMEYGASSEDIARTCHAHPTLSEALKEAALAVDKRAIHS